MNAPSVEIPRYRCHKIVRAAKITAIERDAVTILTFGDISACKQVSYNFDQKHQPEVGGYFVQYEDDYQSYSPADAFEDGYTREPVDFRERVRLERDELDEKLRKLAAFLASPAAAELSEEALNLLQLQRKAMWAYSDILHRRTASFTA